MNKRYWLTLVQWIGCSFLPQWLICRVIITQSVALPIAGSIIYFSVSLRYTFILILRKTYVSDYHWNDSCVHVVGCMC